MADLQRRQDELLAHVGTGSPVSGAGRRPPARVVIAEDEAIIRLDLKEILLAAGYDVVGETGRGDEAVELVDDHRPDLAILDIKMPGMDGVRAAREITAHHQVAVLILTAFSQRDLIEEARDAGVAAYLVKPFRRAELLPAIDDVLARCRQEWAIDAGDRRSGPGRGGAAEDKIETRRLVDEAKAVLMDRHGMDEAEAFAFIQRTAMQTPRPACARWPSGWSTAPSSPEPMPDPTRGAVRPAGRDRCFLLDGMSLAFRAYFALPGRPGHPRRRRHQRRARVRLHARSTWCGTTAPGRLAVAFDLPGATFRDELVDDYKGGRAETPDDLLPQFDMIRGRAGRPGACRCSRCRASRRTTCWPPWPPRPGTGGATWWW